VTVSTSTRTAGGGHELAHFFAPIFGIDGSKVGATASAAWGSPKSGPAMLPLAISACQFDPSLTTGRQLIQINTGPSCVGPNGHAIPGGFGWLVTSGIDCTVTVDTATPQIPSDTGGNFPSNCKEELEDMKNQTLLVPIFGNAGLSGANGWYKIHGFAAFKIEGWRFSGNNDLNWNNNAFTSALRCTGDCRGIIGTFQKFVSLQDGFEYGGPNLGATNVTLTQ
jgi:hypothetical protein